MKREFPSAEEILEFISESDLPAHKSDIAKAFHIRGEARVELKQILKDLEINGLVNRKGKNYTAVSNEIAEDCILEVAKIDKDGELIGYPVHEKKDGFVTKVYINTRDGQIKPGDRVSGKCAKDETTGHYEATNVKKIRHHSEEELVCIYKINHNGEKTFVPTDRRNRKVYFPDADQTEDLKDGDVIAVKITPSPNYETREKATLLRKIADKSDPHAISLISINTYEIPNDFSQEAMQQAKDNSVPALGDREDLRDLPLVTIDGADARDFDDAVYAKETKDGFELIVAIADVSYYVRANTTLDNEAFDRGNSTYFPDRVVPMLPEGLSNDMCSLMPNVDRACMACHMTIDKEGNLKKHHFTRALMNSKARLTYAQAQNGIDFLLKGDGQLDPKVKPIMDDVIKPLYNAYQAFLKARNARQCLELDLPEREVKLDREKNIIDSITVKTRYESMKLIEEFMVAANVAAATTLEKANCIYRVHDKPDPERLTNVRAFITELGYTLTSKEEIVSKHLNHLLQEVKGKPEAPLVNTIILRSQSQAVYGSYNIGHFGLSLEKYAHFTSPIRRYADLIVHRSLVKELGLGDGKLTEQEIAKIEEISDHISITERRSISAERDAKSRYIAMYLSDNVGATFEGRISGVTNKGLFIELDETGADGLIPMKTLDDDYYILDEQNHCLVGRRNKRVYRLAAKIKVKVAEANADKGSMIFALVDSKGADISWAKDAKVPGVRVKRYSNKKTGRRSSPKKGGKRRR